MPLIGLVYFVFFDSKAKNVLWPLFSVVFVTNSVIKPEFYFSEI